MKHPSPKTALPGILVAAALAACSGGGGPRDPGPAPDAADVTDAADAADVTDAADATPDAPRDLPPDAPDAPDAPADLPADAPDAPPLWEGLAGTGPTLGSILGVASHMNTGTQVDPLRDFEFEQYAPFQGFRMRRGFRWNRVEPDRDDWRKDAVEPAVTMSAASGVRVLPLLAYGNDWAQSDPDAYGSLDVTLYARYAGTVAGWFCDTVKDYEIWNEQNITRFWHLPPDPAKYGDLLIASAAAIRAACPDARVVFGGLASWDDVSLFDTWGFLRRTLQARPQACAAFDALALHPYTWFQQDPPEHDEWISFDVVKRSQTAMTDLARQILQEGGCGPRPILYTELGWPTYDLDEDQVARFAVRSLLLAARDGVEGWYWYTFWDDAPDASGIRPHENHFGLWAWPGEDGSVRRPKPAWLALVAAHRVLKDHRFARDLAPALGLPEDVHVLAFRHDAGPVVLAMWDGREMPDLREDGTEAEGGPGTTAALDLPLPACASSALLLDQDGTALPAPAPGPVVPLVLTPRVQYLSLACDAAPGR